MKNVILAAFVAFNGGSLLFAQSVEGELTDLLKENCGICHNGVVRLGGLNVSDEDMVRNKRDEIISSIVDGRMPVGRSDFAGTEKGILILEKLEAL